MRNNKGATTLAVILIMQFVIGILALAGWGQCVYKLCKCDFEPSYKAEVIYGIGSVTGIGVVVGWFDFGEFAKEEEK